MIARKVMLLGELGVGKSSLARRLVTSSFDTTYIPTIGVDVYKYDLPDGVVSEPCSLIIWDTDGSLGEAIFTHVYMKQASAALIVGDVTRRPTLDTMVRLGEGFRQAYPGRHCGFIVNKLDLVHERDHPELPNALGKPGVDVTLTSALTGFNVVDAFHRTAAAILRRGH